jgi:hypothetical protein
MAATNVQRFSGDVLLSGEMNLRQVSNVASLKVNSNVVTEYTGPHDRPLRKYPEVALTADAATDSGYKGYKVSSSFDHTTHQDWNAFDGVTDATVGWHTANSDSTIRYTGTDGEYNGTNATQLSSSSNTVNGEYLQIELPKAIKLKYYILYPQGTSGVDQANSPKRAVLYGSNDESAWTEVHRYTDAIYDSDGRAGIGYTFQVNSNQSYKYFAIVPTHRDNSVSTADTAGISIGELEFYGHEEGSGSLDTTLKTVYNVPATTGTQLEVYYDGRETSSYSGSGTNVNDISPNTNNGTLNGGVGFDSTYKAFTFDGVDDYIDTNITTGTGAWSHSVAFWLKIDQIPSSGVTVYQIKDSTLADNVDPSNHTSPHLNINPATGYINYAFWSNAGNFLDDNGNQLVAQTGVWQHYVVQYDASNGGTNYRDRKIIINGNKEYYPEGGTATALSMVASNKLFIGCITKASTGGPGAFFDGSIANFRLYSKALNADQVKELYDYQKDYFFGSKSQVTLYKGHLGVGVTEPSGQLELAGDERIQEYPPGPMSDYDTNIPGHGVFKAYASNENTNVVWEAFDKSNNNGRHYQHSTSSGGGYSTSDGSYGGSVRLSSSSGTPLGVHVILKMPYQIYLKQFSIQPRNNAGYLSEQTPKDGQVWGSNDGNSWYHLYSYTGLTFTSGTDTVYFNVNHTNAYSYYALIVTKSGGGTNSFEGFSIGELRYFGTPGPTTLDKGSLSLTRSLDVPRISRYDVDTETPRPEKLVLDLDTTVNSTPTDISGKGNHGTFYGGASYSPGDKAFVFDGTDDYIEAATNLGSGNQTLCLSMWLKPETDSRWFIDLGKNTATGGSFFAIRYDTYYKFNIRNGNHLEITAGSLNTWEHLVIIYHGTGSTKTAGTIEGYVNGVPGNVIDSDFADDQLNLSANPPIEIGARTGSSSTDRYFDGQISNFKIYNVALEPSEIKKLYNLGRTGRSMVISDTAVGIGKAPEAQLDVRGAGKFAGAMTVQGQTRLTDFVALGSGTNSTTRLFVDDPIRVKNWNAFNNNSTDGEYTFEARAITLVHFHYSGGEDANIAESYLIACSDTGSPYITDLKTAGYLYRTVGHGTRKVRFWAQGLPSVYNSSNFNLRISAIWKMS